VPHFSQIKFIEKKERKKKRTSSKFIRDFSLVPCDYTVTDNKGSIQTSFTFGCLTTHGPGSIVYHITTHTLYHVDYVHLFKKKKKKDAAGGCRKGAEFEIVFLTF
jgi:hypothetical protein